VTEFQLATMLDKLVFPVLIAPTRFTDLPAELTAHFQMADMSRPEIEADGLNRLRIGLTRAGLHPGHFSWPPPGEPNRPPYRGLRTLEEPDAAIFFGRDALITKGLDALRRMRDSAPERMLVVLGASGAGKSSFLRAGLLARLQRDEESFLVLPILRPARAALAGPTGLARALGLSVPLTSEAIAARFAALRAPLVGRLTRYAQAGRETYTARPPTLILPIDQGEELFAAEQKEASATFAGLTAAFAADENLLAIVTVRSDGFAALQAERTLAAIPRLPLDLPALSPASFKEVVEGPGRLAQPPIRIEPALTEQQLVADLDRADALPLLAFTLERLVRDHGADGVLTLDEYQNDLGGLEGAIGKAVEAAFVMAVDDPDLPGDRAELERLARSAFIPWLVRLERADAVPQRRVATMRELPAAAQPLVRHFINQRLLVSAEREDGETTVEVPHEAVLRHWRLLADWLGEEGEELARCEAVMRAAGDWQRDPNPLLLLHRGDRLARAERLLQRDDLGSLMGADASVYLTACRKAEIAALDRERRQLRRQRRLQRFVGTAVLLTFAVTLIGAWLVLRGQQDLSRQRSRFLASMAHAASNGGLFDRAARLSILAARDTWRQPADPEGEGELGHAAHFLRLHAALHGHADQVYSSSFSPDGSRIVSASADKTARVWREGADGVWTSTMLEGHGDKVWSASYSADGIRIVTASSDNTARVWREGKDGNWSSIPLQGHTSGVYLASFSPNGTHVVTASGDKTARVWSEEAGDVWTSVVLKADASEYGSDVSSASFSPDGDCIVTAFEDDYSPRIWCQGLDGTWLPSTLNGHAGRLYSASFSQNGARLVTASGDTTARVWHKEVGGAWASVVLKGHQSDVFSAAFSPNGTSIVTASYDQTARVWREHADGTWSATILEGHQGPVWSAAFSHDGTRVVTTSGDLTARVWREGAEGTWSAVVLAGHEGSVGSGSFSPDGSRIVTSSDDMTARVWRAEAAESSSIIDLGGNERSTWLASLSPDGTRIVTASWDMVTRLWRKGANDAWSADPLGDERAHNKIASFSRDGKRIVTASSNTIRVWHEGADGIWSSVALEGHKTTVTSASFSPDGTRIVSADFDGTARVWHEDVSGAWSSAALEGPKKTHPSVSNSATFSEDGFLVLSGSGERAWLWREGADKRWSAILADGIDGDVLPGSLSPDGMYIVTREVEGWARVWRKQEDSVWVASSLEDGGELISVSFSPDGSRIVTGHYDETPRVWREGADRVWSATPLEGHQGFVLSVSFSRDGTRMVTTSSDRTARIWEIAWLIGDKGRAWANAHNPKLELKPLVEAACAEKLVGTERILRDAQGDEINRESIRRLTKADTDAAPILRGREGEDVCACQPSLVDGWLNWIFRDLWRSAQWGPTPPPS
jgi:WD40 repeat protein